MRMLRRSLSDRRARQASSASSSPRYRSRPAAALAVPTVAVHAADDDEVAIVLEEAAAASNRYDDDDAEADDDATNERSRLMARVATTSTVDDDQTPSLQIESPQFPIGKFVSSFSRLKLSGSRRFQRPPLIARAAARQFLRAVDRRQAACCRPARTRAAASPSIRSRSRTKSAKRADSL